MSRKAQELGFEVEFFQSNHEGEIIDKIHRAYFEKVDAIIINPGAYTHYSYAIHDAIKAVNIPTIEVHISNIHAREEFRHKSVIAPACTGQISGFGIKSYIIALYALKEILD
nr:type II 3-dehydroquinate dehydratase [Caldicellulosiruptor bescii]